MVSLSHRVLFLHGTQGIDVVIRVPAPPRTNHHVPLCHLRPGPTTYLPSATSLDA